MNHNRRALSTRASVIAEDLFVFDKGELIKTTVRFLCGKRKQTFKH